MWTRRDFLGAAGLAGMAAGLQGCGVRNEGARAGGKGLTAERLAVLKRHAVRVAGVEPLAVLSVGNGNFAFNVDCTGLQSLPGAYKTIPLATLAHWGWHSMPRPAGLPEYRMRMVPFYGRLVPYDTEQSSAAASYLRANPHMLNLGRVGLVLDGKELAAEQVSKVAQELDLATGVVTSRFELAGVPVEVVTCNHPDYDGIGVRVASELLRTGRLGVLVAFGYGSAKWSGDGADWEKPEAHQTTVVRYPGPSQYVTLNRTVDESRYGVRVGWNWAGGAGPAIHEIGRHRYELSNNPMWGAGGGNVLEASICFDTEPNRATPLYSFAEARAASSAGWNDFWANGAFIDLGDCTDGRAPELERRIVLSQYMTAIHCAGQYPSQETGLLCNSWFGKFHLEMHWWHSVHFTVWDRQRLFARSLPIYAKLLESSRARAARQGFKGARWPKMIGPDGEDSPSSVGALLIWQQPHPIYYAELCWRDDPTVETLKRWRSIVVETAEFMASFAQYVGTPGSGRYVLGPMIKTVSENAVTETTLNPTYELTAWRFGLMTAQAWLERLGEGRNAAWDAVIDGLAKAATIGEGAERVYLMQEDMPGTYTKEWAWEHPAVLGAYGVLRGDGIDPAVMAATVRKLRGTWDFARVWGWDFPMCALAAARTMQPEMAVDFLTMEAPMNRYLENGCNFQRGGNNPVPAYFPGNGGLLAAVGMMAGGWDGGPRSVIPGFPKDGKWKVRGGGFRRWI